MIFLTQQELQELLKVIKSPRDKTIFLLAYRHGLRASEVGLLQESDIDFSRNKIHIRRLKGSISSEQLLAPDEIKAIKKWLKRKQKFRTPYLFPSRQNTPISRQMLDILTKKYGKEIGLREEKCHFHILKHSLAVHLLDAGADILLVKDLLGHRNIQSTMDYAEFTSAKRDELHRKILESPRIVKI